MELVEYIVARQKIRQNMMIWYCCTSAINIYNVNTQRFLWYSSTNRYSVNKQRIPWENFKIVCKYFPRSKTYIRTDPHYSKRSKISPLAGELQVLHSVRSIKLTKFCLVGQTRLMAWTYVGCRHTRRPRHAGAIRGTTTTGSSNMPQFSSDAYGKSWLTTLAPLPTPSLQLPPLTHTHTLIPKRMQ